MSKFVEVLLTNGNSEIFNVDHIGHLLPAQVGKCDVFLRTKDSSGNYYGYNIDTTFDIIKSKLIDTYDVGTLPFVVNGRKIVKGTFEVRDTI